MSWIKDAREELATGLRSALADVHVYSYWPERPQPPCVMTAAGSPYLDTENVVFGAYRLRWELRVVAPGGPNQDAQDGLDALLTRVLAALSDLGVVAKVDAPVMYQVAGAQFIAVDVFTSNTYRPEEG